MSLIWYMVIMMLASSITVILDIIFIRNMIFANEVYLIILGVAIALLLIAFAIGIANIIYQTLTLHKNKANPYKRTLIVKIILIPFYVVNFLFWLLIMAGFLNPFLLIVTPFILFLGLSCTYFLMMLTNVDNFFYIFKSIITLKMPLTKSFIVGVVFHFFLGLDLLGSMIVLFNNKE